MGDIQTTIVGAGVIGLAIAQALIKQGHEVLVIEQHEIIGAETSSRNSEVIHAGIYYQHGSTKARMCVAGKGLLYDFCREHSVSVNKVGKIIVATNDQQLLTLNSIVEKANANGVNDLRFLSIDQMREIEPQLTGVGGILSPSTGIIDSHGYMLALQGSAEDGGCQFAFNTKVESVARTSAGEWLLNTVNSEDSDTFALTSQNLIICTGLFSGGDILKSLKRLRIKLPEIKYAKGNYFNLSQQSPFSHLIYPVPQSAGLGVHLTLDLAGQVRFGPDVEWVKSLNYDVDAERVQEFYSAIRSYWPDLPDNCLTPSYSGIRPKIFFGSQPYTDFMFIDQQVHEMAGLVVLMGIESPGLTSSLAIAEHVAELLAVS